MAERVLVVRRSSFFGGMWPQGFVPWCAGEAETLIASFESEACFASRDEAERDPSLKQLIPYCAVERRGRRRELFCVQRTQSQSEARLHGLWSIGFGGHVNPEDGEERTHGVLARALARELAEELVLPPGCPPVPIGLINDDGPEVGRVHAGIAYLVSVPGGTEVGIREADKMTGGFQPLPAAFQARGAVAGSAAPWQDPARLESWSQFLLEVLIRPPTSTSDHAASTNGG